MRQARTAHCLATHSVRVAPTLSQNHKPLKSIIIYGISQCDALSRTQAAGHAYPPAAPPVDPALQRNPLAVMARVLAPGLQACALAGSTAGGRGGDAAAQQLAGAVTAQLGLLEKLVGGGAQVAARVRGFVSSPLLRTTRITHT